MGAADGHERRAHRSINSRFVGEQPRGATKCFSCNGPCYAESTWNHGFGGYISMFAAAVLPYSPTLAGGRKSRGVCFWDPPLILCEICAKLQHVQAISKVIGLDY